MDSTKKGMNRNTRVELSFLERVRSRVPDNPHVLEALGEMYTRSGCYEEGLRCDLELTKLCPRESLPWYNLACSYALTGRKDEAFRALGTAIDLGYRDVRWMNVDRDLESLRTDPRFRAMIKKAGVS